MASPRYQPIGPLAPGNTVLLCATINNIPFVATVQTDKQSVLFRSILGQNAQNDVDINLNESNVLQFQIEGDSTRLQLNATIGGRLLPLSSGSPPVLVLSLQNATGSYPYLSVSSAYEAPPSPNILLSGAQYNVLGSANGTSPPSSNVSIRYMNPLGSGVLTAQVPLIPVALNYIATVPGTGSSRSCSTPNTNVREALRVFYCSWCKANSTTCQGFCINLRVPVNTWTNLSDCSNDYQYIYCNSGTFCGGNAQRNCFAQCPSGNACTLNLNSQVLTCNGPVIPTPITPPFAPIVPTGPSTQPLTPITNITPWYESWWVVVAVVIVFILILLLIYEFSNSTPSYTEPSSYSQTTVGKQYG